MIHEHILIFMQNTEQLIKHFEVINKQEIIDDVKSCIKKTCNSVFSIIKQN